MRLSLDRARRLPGRTPLRVRLVLVVLMLVAVALIGSGIAATTILRSYLVGRVDDQLRGLAQSTSSSVTKGTLKLSVVPDGGRGRRDHERLPSAYVVEVLNAKGTPTYGPSHDLVDEKEPLPRLPTVTAAQTTAAGTTLRTVPATQGDETWRVISSSVTLSDGSKGTLLVAQSLGDVDGTIDQLAGLMLAIGGVAIVVIGGVGYLTVRASLRPLREVEHTAAAIAGGELSRRVPHDGERTEVGSLATSLNTMLNEIESAFAARAASEHAARASEDRMRRFVADASHELRTPLTTIRGFAELYRQGAVTDADGVQRFMGRIEGEATRMGLLVEDLLLLARMDQQRPLRQDPVDLLALVSDAVQDAAHDAQLRASDHRITLHLGITDPPPMVLGDEARLRQVLANLLGNAVRHTPNGTSVTVRLATFADAGTVELLVADDGPGLAPEHARRVFERFYRADSARNRDDGGSGLGLAIVAALVAGHGGTVRLDAGPAQGATFRVELPLLTATGPGPSPA